MAVPLAVQTLMLTAALAALASLAAARRAPGESSTILRDRHSRRVAACRHRGNLYAFYEPFDRCMPLLEEQSSPCPKAGDVLVLNATTLEAQCMRLPCDITHVLLPDGGCHAKNEFCNHAEDKELVLKETGYGTCDCPDLHVYWQPTDRCFEAFTRGPCAAGEYIVFREGAGVLCEVSPCPEGQVPWRKQCVPRRGHGCLNSDHGHLVVNPATLRYECTLRCPDGMVEMELECYYLFSRGPCPPGQYVTHVSGSQRGRCADNPCGEDDALPWAGRCWQRGQYCSLAGPQLPSELNAPSDTRRPQKREPVRLPNESHLIILGRDELRPQPAAVPATGPASPARPPTAAGELGLLDVMVPPLFPGPAPPMVSLTDEEVAAHELVILPPELNKGPGPVTSHLSVVPPPDFRPPSHFNPASPQFRPPPSQFSHPVTPLQIAFLSQPGGGPETIQTPAPPSRLPAFASGRPSRAHGPSLPTLPNSYLPPPPSSYTPQPASSLIRRHVSPHRLSKNVMSLADIANLRPFIPSGGGVARRRSARSARLDGTTASRIAELRESNGFVSIDDDGTHPFNGDYEGANEVHGLHINVNPLTYQVECSDAIGFYRTTSFAHYKCRPGSRRDLLGECHHEGPTWIDYHPERCPFGRRHNLLTGRCIRIR